MPRITQIKPQKDPKRVNVYLDGRFSFGLDMTTLVKNGLKVGRELSEKEVEALTSENDFQKLLDKALRLLSFRPRSEKEVRDYFKRKIRDGKPVADGNIDKVIAWLKDGKFLDDQAFAEWWLEQRTTFRPRGKRALNIELRQKGVGQEIINKVIGNLDEPELARKAASKKLKLYQKLPPLEFRQKMSNFLLRQGFSWETVREVVANYLKKD